MKKRLLTPEDFSLQVSTVPLSTLSIPQPSTTQSELPDTNVESFNLLLSCLYPKSLTFYPCFNKPNGIQPDSFSSSSNSSVIENETRYEAASYQNENYFKESLIKESFSLITEENDKHERSQSLLTPESFLITKEHDSPVLSIQCVPEIFLKSPNCSSTSEVQNKASINKFLAPCNKDLNISKENFNKKEFHSDDDKSFQITIQRSDAKIASASVRRKLAFDGTPETFSNYKEAEEIIPKFSCSLKISDDDIDNLISQNDSETVIKNIFPPIGVFWDIENCRVPKGLSATHVVQAVRNRFFDGYREAEFVCVCDTLKENPKILEELNDAQVNVMHVGSIVKNAADDKLLQSMRRFADIHGAGASIVLISGDSDFATELYDLRYRKKLHVILVHNAHAQDSLKLSAHETVLYSDLTQEIPYRSFRSNKKTHGKPDFLSKKKTISRKFSSSC